MDKKYFLINQRKTFDAAVEICKYRGERLVQISNQQENYFIFNTIVKPLNSHIWLGATNIVGTNNFTWLDGSELTFHNL